MKRELRLVKGGQEDTPERDLAGEGLVRATLGRPALDAGDHEALLALSLGDDAAAFSVEEKRAAEELRAALEGQGTHALAPFAGALRALTGHGALDAAAHETLLARALAATLVAAPASAEAVDPAARAGDDEHEARGPVSPHAPASARKPARTPARRRAWPWFALGSALAAAAALVVLLRTGAFEREGPRAGAVEWMASRSTKDLWDPAQPFAARGGESARMDRIARARAADLRANRYASWGVR